MYNDEDYCIMHYNITLQKLPSHEGQSTVQQTKRRYWNIKMGDVWQKNKSFQNKVKNNKKKERSDLYHNNLYNILNKEILKKR